MEHKSKYPSAAQKRALRGLIQQCGFTTDYAHTLVTQKIQAEEWTFETVRDKVIPYYRKQVEVLKNLNDKEKRDVIFNRLSNDLQNFTEIVKNRDASDLMTGTISVIDEANEAEGDEEILKESEELEKKEKAE